MTDSLIAIVPAAGIGQRATRAGEPALPKQYRLLLGLPMLRRAVLSLLNDVRINQVFVAVSPGDSWVKQALEGLPRTFCGECGGATRAQTVQAALDACGARDNDWVLVHDAARPGLPAEALGRLIDTCLVDEVGGLLALPVADTVKSQRAVLLQANDADSSNASRVRATLDRDGLWLAQTPQMFRVGVLSTALSEAQINGVNVTDEASAVEAAGHEPLLVRGSLKNFKVTWPEDFELMEKWL